MQTFKYVLIMCAVIMLYTVTSAIQLNNVSHDIKHSTSVSKNTFKTAPRTPTVPPQLPMKAVPKQATTSIPQQDTLLELYESCRKRHSYECPLPHPLLSTVPTQLRHRFTRLPAGMIDIQEDEQKELWLSFVTNGCVTPAHHTALFKNTGGMFPNLDRIALFCIVKHIQPNHILEIGAGESSAVIDATGSLANRTIIEPYRWTAVNKKHTVIKKELQTVELSVFKALVANDILFIDSSHVVMPYGDTLTELITILPHLNEGVIVHIHDIFLPFDYPHEAWGYRLYTEQWLVALMLWGNPCWKVMWGSAYMRATHANVLSRMPAIPPIDFNVASMWLRKTCPSN